MKYMNERKYEKNKITETNIVSRKNLHVLKKKNLTKTMRKK